MNAREMAKKVVALALEQHNGQVIKEDVDANSPVEHSIDMDIDDGHDVYSVNVLATYLCPVDESVDKPEVPKIDKFKQDVIKLLDKYVEEAKEAEDDDVLKNTNQLDRFADFVLYAKITKAFMD